MNTTHTINRRRFLLATAGAAMLAFSPSRRARATVDIYEVVNGPLNLCAGAGLGYSIVAVLANGTTMEIIDVGGTANGYEWVKVWVSSLNKTGFVARTFIAKVTSAPVDGAFPVGSTAVTTTTLNVRSGAGLSYPVIVALWAGAPVTITGAPAAAGGYTWYPIKTGYGTAGWVAGAFLQASAATPPPPTSGFAVGEHVVTTAAINLRRGAGLSYAVIVVLWEGAPLTITGAPVAESGYTWYPVKTGYGSTGWVAGINLAKSAIIAPTFAIGDVVRLTDGPLNLRTDPGLAAPVLRVLASHEVLLVKGGPVAMDGYTWYQVWNYGGMGWAAGEFLAYEPGGFPSEGGG